MALEEVSSSKCFGGYQKVFAHQSTTTNCTMKFSIYIPPNVEKGEKVPVVYFLPGYSDDEQTFVIKSGFQRYAAQYKLCVVSTDTSPRNIGIVDDPGSPWCGNGGGFYLDATEEKWKKHYNMHSYVTKELPALIESTFPFVLSNKRSISGISMGGGGALTCALKNPGKYMICTVFAPLGNATGHPKTRAVLKSYLGENETVWQEWNATHLAATYTGPPLHLLIDIGTEDPFRGILLVEHFVEACHAAKVPVEYRKQKGYDHSYHFAATFMEDHFRRHADILYSQLV